MEMQDKPGPFFSVVQLGLNAVAILGGVVGDTAFSPYLESLFLLFMPADYAAKSAFFASDAFGAGVALIERNLQP